MTSFASLESDVVRWAEARKIIPNSTPQAQLGKLVEELGELFSATNKGLREEAMDGVGDVLVCLINYCALMDMNIVDCLQMSYDQIKNRKGTLMPNGIFVKE